MAQATAHCTCCKCGTEVERTTTKRNRTEADRWAEWMEAQTDVLCTQCWAADQRKKEAETPLTAEIRADIVDQKIVIVMTGNTMPHKDEIKAAGYRWSEGPATGIVGMIGIVKPKMAWSKIVDPENYDAAIAEARGLGAEIKCDVTEMDLAAFAKISGIKREKEEKVNDAVASIEKPEAPEIYTANIIGHRWNHTIYGRSGNHSIYIDGNKIDITDEQAAALESYDVENEEYKRKGSAAKASIQ